MRKAQEEWNETNVTTKGASRKPQMQKGNHTGMEKGAGHPESIPENEKNLQRQNQKGKSEN